ncbi:hypothetical protein BC937DRAFT_86159 [Endogone sp. FLAS-F59071]|nr:hypothetical protein BC937DRAFT_86159 [Endogone sp. FLAS-F59071]|eukprot:RUS22865.1 hypothetical protein BC937DRAFT_86159 [Endogone sp. FLAS-F59071]
MADVYKYCPPWAPFLGFAGIFSSMVLSSLGAAYGTAKSGVGIAGMGVFRPELIMKALIPVVMSGIIAVYGLVMAYLQAKAILFTRKTYLGFLSIFISQYLQLNTQLFRSGFLQLGAGLSVGFGGLAAGYSVGIVGDYVMRPCLRTGESPLRIYDIDSHLRRGTRPVWLNCRAHSQYQSGQRDVRRLLAKVIRGDVNASHELIKI